MILGKMIIQVNSLQNMMAIFMYVSILENQSVSILENFPPTEIITYHLSITYPGNYFGYTSQN